MKNDSSKVRLNLLCLVALSTVCLLAGCGSSERARLTGRWEIAEAGKLSSRIGNGEDSEPGQSKMTVLFENSGKLSTDTAMGNINSSKQGTWRMIDYDESKNRYLNGIAEYLTVLTAQNTAQQSELTVSTAHRDSVAARIAIFSSAGDAMPATGKAN